MRKLAQLRKMADENDVYIGGKSISSLRVVDLKKECEKRGLSKSGSKSQLVDRLKTQVLVENLGKDSAPAPKLQEDECQNEFIKQYLAQQKQLIENVESSMNSSSQESDADDVPRKRRSVDQSPPFHSPTLEVSPEKPVAALEKRGPAIGKSEPVSGKPKPVSEEKQKSKQPAGDRHGDSVQEPAVESRPVPTESKSEGAVEEPETMGRGRRKISRLDSGSKSQGDLADNKPTERRSRRSRNSGSTGDNQNTEDVAMETKAPVADDKESVKNDEIKESDKAPKEKASERKKEDKVEAPEPVKEAKAKVTEPVKEDKAKVTEPVKEDKVKAPEPVKGDKSKVSEPAKEDKAKPPEPVKEDKAKVTEPVIEDKVKVTEALKEDIAKAPEPVKENKAEVTKRVKEDKAEVTETVKENKAKESKQVEEGENAAEPLKEDKVTEKMEVDPPESVGQGSGESKTDLKRDEQNKTDKVSREEKNRARSRSKTPPQSVKQSKQPAQVSSSKKSRARSGSSSSSSSSSSDSSRSGSRGRKDRARSSSSSSSSSRSRSRTPDKKKKPILRKKVQKAGRSDSSSRSRSRSPTPKRVKKQSPPKTEVDAPKQAPPVGKEIKKRSPSRSSSSRSRSRSPVAKEPQVENKKEDLKTPAQEPMETETVVPKEVDTKVTSESTNEVPAQQTEVKVSKKISLNRKNIEDAGKTVEETADGDKADASDKPPEEKPAKKRKWGSRSTSTAQKTKVSSLPITTESLKGLMPDIKPSLKLAPEPVLEDEMDYEDDATTTEPVVTEQEDTRSVKIQRTVTQDVKKDKDKDSEDSGSESEGEKEEEAEKKENSDDSEDDDGKDDGSEEENEDDKREMKAELADGEEPMEKKAESKLKEEESKIKQTKTITVTTKVKKEKKDKNKEIKLIKRLDSGGSILVKPDEPVKARRSPSPARNPASKIIHIRNLVRPFTANQLKELLKRTGNLNEELFWIDKIKSHCFAVYDTEDEAVETRKALHNTTWPLSNPKTLIVDFGSEEQMDYYRGDEKPIPPPEKKERTSLREQRQKEKEEKQRQVQEERQKEIERRQKEREKRMKEKMERMDPHKPVREWDKDKKSREDWDRTLQKSRSRSPRDRRGRRSGSGSPEKERRRERSSERSKEREGRREKKKVAEKKDDEPPAKLLDDLFRKTKTTPCIYWLPLSETEIADRENIRKAKPVLRQKQEGDRVSPMVEIPESERAAVRRRRSSSPAARRKPSQEPDRSRGKRVSPERRRRESSPDPRSRSGGRRPR